MLEKNLIDTILDLKRKEADALSPKMKFKEMITVGLGGTIGGPIFVILGRSLYEAKSGLLISLIISGLLMISFVAIFSELALSLSIQGVGYRVFKESLGPAYEFIFAWITWIGNIIFAALSSQGFVYSLYIFFPNLELTDLSLKIISSIIISIFFIFNLKSPKYLGKLMKGLTICLVLGFLFYIFYGLIAGSQINKDFSADLFREKIEVVPVLSQTASVFLIYCVYEWQSSFTLMMDKFDKVERPKKTIPRMYMITIIFAVILYFLVALTSIMNIGGSSTPLWNEITTSDIPMALIFHHIMGNTGIIIIGIVGVIATLTSINAGMQMSTHLLYQLGRDGFLPRQFAMSKNKVNYIALIVSYGASLLITIFGDISYMTNITSFIFLASMGFLCVAIILMRRKMPNLERPWKITLFPQIPIISGVACFILILTVEITAIQIGLLLLAIGFLIYFIWVYIFNHSAVLEREGIIGRREEILKRRELEVLLMKSKVAREMAEKMISSDSSNIDLIAEEKLNFIHRLKDFEAIETKNLLNIKEIDKIKQQITNRLEKITLILRLEELERLEQKNRVKIESDREEQENNETDLLVKQDILTNQELQIKKLALFDILKNIIYKQQKKIHGLKDLDNNFYSLKSKALIKKLEDIEKEENILIQELGEIYNPPEDIKEIKSHIKKKSSIEKEPLAEKEEEFTIDTKNKNEEKPKILHLFKNRHRKKYEEYKQMFSDGLEYASYIDIDSLSDNNRQTSEKDDLMNKLKEIEDAEKDIYKKLTKINSKRSRSLNRTGFLKKKE